MIRCDKDDLFDYSWLFSSMWKTAILVGVLTAVPAAILYERAPWLIAIPLIAGAAYGAYLELRCIHGEPLVAEVPEEVGEAHDLVPTQSFHSNFWLILKKQKFAGGQLDLFESIVEDPKDRRKVYVLHT